MPWYNIDSRADRDAARGIIVGVDPIPVNMQLIEELVTLGFDREHAIKCVKNNRHNHLTATYYLIMKKGEAK